MMMGVLMFIYSYKHHADTPCVEYLPTPRDLSGTAIGLPKYIGVVEAGAPDRQSDLAVDRSCIDHHPIDPQKIHPS